MIFREKITPMSFTKFILPSILVMLCISIYTVVDGIFVARFVGSNALAAINIVLPLYTIAFAVGIMFSTGGGALVSIKLGQKHIKEASENFTQLLVVGISFGILATVICLLFRNHLLQFLGATTALKPYAKDYSFFMIISFPVLICKVLFEGFLRADGNPGLSLKMSILGGVTNIVLDYIFIVPMGMGISGAGLGTFLGAFISLFIGFAHFQSGRSVLSFSLSPIDYSFLLKTVTNGSSEMVNEIAIAFTTLVFNTLTLKYAGNSGVAAISIILYINFIFSSIYIGFSTGVAPLISYQYGARNEKELNTVLLYCRRFLMICSPFLFVITLITTPLLVSIFVNQSDPVYSIAVQGLYLFSISFIFNGLNMYGSGLFTALSNGKISALISFSKTFIFFLIGSLTLPVLFKLTGVWLIQPLAEGICAILVVYFMKSKSNKKYCMSS